MVAVKRRRKKPEEILGKDAYHIEEVTVGVCLPESYNAPQHALYRAQTMAEKAEKETEFHVIRRPLLGGQEHVAYRVLRDKCGVVLTFTEED